VRYNRFIPTGEPFEPINEIPNRPTIGFIDADRQAAFTGHVAFYLIHIAVEAFN